MKIIVFEGWMMGADSYVSRMLRSIGVKFEGHAFNEVLKPTTEKCIFLGHSLGGHQAIKHAKAGDTLITFDPRWQNAASYFDVLFPFQKPFHTREGVKGFNFYRHGLMPGYPVTGAKNTKLSWVSHAGVPAAVAKEVKAILEREGK